MLRGLFITGTDTGVGKTTVAAALMHRYRAPGTLKYWKPIQTGIEVDDDTRTVGELGGCRDEELHRDGIRLARPLEDRRGRARRSRRRERARGDLLGRGDL